MLIHHNITEGGLSAEDIEAIHEQAAELADLQGAPSPDFVDQCIADHLADLQSAPSPPNLQPATCNLQPDPAVQDSRATKGSVEKTQLLSPFSSEPLEQQASLPSSAGQPAPTQDSRLATRDTPSTQNSRLETRDTPSTQDSGLETRDSQAEFEAKYSCITRPYMIHHPHRYIDVIRDIMESEALTDAQAIEEMRRERRRNQWKWDELIESCIADYAKMHPRLAGYTIPPLPRPLEGLERYYRPQPQPPGDVSTHPSPSPKSPGDLRGS